LFAFPLNDVPGNFIKQGRFAAHGIAKTIFKNIQFSRDGLFYGV
jgi:hypothetical protein